MKVQVLEEATADLADGFRFYERRGEGLGDYFLDSLWSDMQITLPKAVREQSMEYLRIGVQEMLETVGPFKPGLIIDKLDLPEPEWV